jgi:hypothetical protein
MGRDSHFTGQTVYSQVLKLLDKDKIHQISREHPAAIRMSSALEATSIWMKT